MPKSLVIISPHFPPNNGADMHRVRQSVHYFEAMGWRPIVFAVDPARVEMIQDPLLLQSVPSTLELHRVWAWNPRFTRKLGLGALALRSMWYYFTAVNRYLKTHQADLIYFSTTQFPLLALGCYWKWRFGVPYVIDMQDPWHSDYYQSKPKHERPPKHWFSYRLNKWLEPVAMRAVSGIVSVSQTYCDQLMERYPNIVPERCTVIPFGAFEQDMDVAKGLGETNFFSKEHINMVYVGRGGTDMHVALGMFFEAFRRGLERYPYLFDKVRMHFIGTSYAPQGKGKPTILPLAQAMGLQDYVYEQTDRLPYYAALRYLLDADALLIPGSDSAGYTASKLYPYILAQKPLLAVFQAQSSVVHVLQQTKAGMVHTFQTAEDAKSPSAIESLLLDWKAMLEKLPYAPPTDWHAFTPYTAEAMTRRQVDFFDKIVDAEGFKKQKKV